MRTQWNLVVALAVVSLIGLSNAGADGGLSPGRTALGSTTTGGLVNSTVTAHVPARHSGIAGQVFLDVVNYPPVPPAPLPATLSVYVQTGNHFSFVGDFDTKADGTFLIELPPGTYVLNPASSSPYLWYSGQWAAITVVPRQVTCEELVIVSNPSGIFP